MRSRSRSDPGASRFDASPGAPTSRPSATVCAGRRSRERNAPGQGVVVLDSYEVSADSVRGLAADSRLVLMHDRDAVAEAEIVTSTVGGEDAPGRLRLFGLAYACLRPSYWGVPERQTADSVRRVLVATGGGDWRGRSGAGRGGAGGRPGCRGRRPPGPIRKRRAARRGRRRRGSPQPVRRAGRRRPDRHRRGADPAGSPRPRAPPRSQW